MDSRERSRERGQRRGRESNKTSNAGKCAIRINVIHVINLEGQYRVKYDGSVYRELLKLIAEHISNFVANLGCCTTK